MKCRYIIVKRHDHHKEKESHEEMHDAGIMQYMEKHGSHFTVSLAEEASRRMLNSNGNPHTWKAQQVHESIVGIGLNIPANVTLGDVTYLANMYYADLYPEVLKDEQSCIRAAVKTANDPDGYEGMTFRRWLADLSVLDKEFNFTKFI